MDFEERTWVTGDLISASGVNRIEEGLTEIINALMTGTVYSEILDSDGNAILDSDGNKILGTQIIHFK